MGDLEEYKAQARSTNKVLTLIGRGLLVSEVKAILHHHDLVVRDRAFLRALYETWYRPNELVMCDITDYNKRTGELVAHHTKRKFNPRSGKSYDEPPKHQIVTETTQHLFRLVISTRKKGPIFVNRKGERISVRYMESVIDNVARAVGIQQVQAVTPTGRLYHLVQLKALREAGERHCDEGGGDTFTSAKAAQHSRLVKERHYHRSPWEAIQENTRDHHPAFKGEV